jgi:hypothetical protein
MAANTTSGAAPSRAARQRLDVARLAGAVIDEPSDTVETPTRGNGRDQSHLQARRHRRWLRSGRRVDSEHNADVHAWTPPAANERSPDSAREGDRP